MRMFEVTLAKPLGKHGSGNVCVPFTPDPFLYCIYCRAAFTYEGKLIKHEGSGTEYAEFLELLGGALRSLRCTEAQQEFVDMYNVDSPFPFPMYVDDERVYGYVRFETGDEMSRRAKFAFITWIGPGVGALKKAKVSTDKAFMKEIMTVSKFCIFPDWDSTRQSAAFPRVL